MATANTATLRGAKCAGWYQKGSQTWPWMNWFLVSVGANRTPGMSPAPWLLAPIIGDFILFIYLLCFISVENGFNCKLWITINWTKIPVCVGLWNILEIFLVCVFFIFSFRVLILQWWLNCFWFFKLDVFQVVYLPQLILLCRDHVYQFAVFADTAMLIKTRINNTGSNKHRIRC